MYLKALLKYIFQGGHRADSSQGSISFCCCLKQGERAKLRVASSLIHHHGAHRIHYLFQKQTFSTEMAQEHSQKSGSER